MNDTFADMMTDLTSLLPDEQNIAEATKDAEQNIAEQQNSVQVKETINRHQVRRVLSELALEKQLPWHFQKGVTYHCISFGDVDSLTYMRVIVKQQRIKYALLSTWCMATEDIKEIRSWVEQGYIERIDFYIGEIFKNSYRPQYDLLIKFCKELGGRVAMFRNHSKIMVLIGENFDAVIEGSANVNTNPRTEQCAITIDRDLALWYKNFFDGINSFERNFDDVKPMVV